MLSVIVPVYNAEKYLSRCLDSLLLQGLEDYEIICVNDGSTDGSAQVLEGYSKRFPIIRVIAQANGGSPSARNAGMDAAKGDVLTFCDADDYLIPNSYKYLLETYWDDKVDVLKFDSITLDKYVKKHWIETNDPRGNVVFEGMGHDFYQRMMPYFVWQHLYRTSFLREHGLHFRSLTLCDDTTFCLDVFMRNPRTLYVDSNVYRYVIVEGQLTRRRDSKSMRRIVDSYVKLFGVMNEYAQTIPELRSTMDLYKEQQMIPCSSRILSASYSHTEWRALREVLHRESVLPMHLIGKVSLFINVVMNHYAFYLIVSLLYRYFFVPYVLPQMKRN